MEHKQQGFTLAEVLITLMVIGILAVITIPSILQSWQETETVSKLRKTYSILQQACKLAEIDNGAVTSWDSSNNTSSYVFWDNIKKYLSIAADCQNKSGCAPDKFSNKNDPSVSSANNVSTKRHILLKDGTSITYGGWTSPKCDINNGHAGSRSICADLIIDINGTKAPNTMGIDAFVFYITPEGIALAGGPDTDYYIYSHNDHCIYKSYSNGYSCTKWVIEKGNMLYLHQNNTPWE